MEYTSKLSLIETEQAIKFVKDAFEKELSYELHLTRVSAPLFVLKSSGLNDDLNGIERPVSFDLQEGGDAEIVQSLAKWKRYALSKYNFGLHNGLYTDMNAVRRDEICDEIHSFYVDQWDWEKVISENERTVEFLKHIVENIYAVIRRVADKVRYKYPQVSVRLPKDITFITTQELADKYPSLSYEERENAIVKEHGAVFVIGIGWPLSDGKPHGGRAPDYDDWNLNGDLLVYYHMTDASLELSSMGIRVDKESLLAQLDFKNELARTKLPYHASLLNDTLPLTIGGGIGQSRLCMLMLEKAHIGEVQASIWPDSTLENCNEKGIILL